MFTQEFTNEDERTRVTLTRDLEGWELREERDHTLIKLTHYSDWHRVERALRAMGFGLVLTAQLHA